MYAYFKGCMMIRIAEELTWTTMYSLWVTALKVEKTIGWSKTGWYTNILNGMLQLLQLRQ